MLVIGMTGGIGSGKTTVAELFAAQGVPIIDTDKLAHALVAPHQDALRDIAATFGVQVLAPDGSLDRARLRKLVFDDAQQRHALERILHPRIKDAVRHELARLAAPYCIVVIPLLIESGMTDLVDRVLVIDAPEELQVMRARARDGVDEAMVRRIMSAQTSRQARLEAADDIIHNETDLAQLQRQVTELHHTYLRLARRSRPTKHDA